MLQQTVAVSVIPYFEKWMKAFPTVEILATSDLSELISLWEGLGYYSRCRNIHKAANAIMASHNGKLPATYKELLSLPGIGDYTARAILSIAWKRPYAVFDANVRRIIQRLLAAQEWNKDLEKQSVRRLEELIPNERPGDFNEAMMQLGQQVCTSSTPDCGKCPLSEACTAREKGIAEEIPLKIKKIIKNHKKYVILIQNERRFLLKKKKRGLFHDLWLIPSVEAESEEKIQWMDRDWLMSESLGLKKHNHFYTDNKDILTTHLFTLDKKNSQMPIPDENEDYLYKWIDFEELGNFPCPSTYRKIINEALKIINAD